ncbi:aquaporin [Thalassobius sp. MITS945101]|uniref:aquaporin n=1 Tax=Thalassobius sp. MITS945101 TaxID=3096994 RepID=UPI00399A3A2E
MKQDLLRRLIAEGLGTLLLVCTVVGSGIMADKLTDDVALALLGNTIPTGAILVVLITIFGPISGAHFNPAVSLVMALRGELRWAELAPYVVLQSVGAVLGSMVAHGMFDLSIVQYSTTSRTGGAQWFAEGVATFGLLMTILGAVRFRSESVAVMVGLYITAAYWFTASTSFANPAVTIGRAFTDTFAGIAPVDVSSFILAQIAGALVALVIAGVLFTPATDAETAEAEA